MTPRFAGPTQAKEERRRARLLIEDGQTELQRLQLDRSRTEVRLRDFRLSDLRRILEADPQNSCDPEWSFGTQPAQRRIQRQDNALDRL